MRTLISNKTQQSEMVGTRNIVCDICVSSGLASIVLHSCIWKSSLQILKLFSLSIHPPPWNLKTDILLQIFNFLRHCRRYHSIAPFGQRSGWVFGYGRNTGGWKCLQLIVNLIDVLSTDTVLSWGSFFLIRTLEIKFMYCNLSIHYV